MPQWLVRTAGTLKYLGIDSDLYVGKHGPARLHPPPGVLPNLKGEFWADSGPNLLHNVKHHWTSMLTETDSSLTKHGWIIALTIVIGAGATAAGIGLQIREFLKRKRR
jgi:hypothetical protein